MTTKAISYLFINGKLPTELKKSLDLVYISFLRGSVVTDTLNGESRIESIY